MKHILKKFHFGSGGGNHESSSSSSPGRPNELLTVAPSGSSPSPLTSPFSSSAPTLTPPPDTASTMSAPSSSLTSGHGADRHSSGATPAIALPSSVSMLPTSPADSDAVSAAIRAQMVAADYFSSEEEFQVQLAMAISASDSELLEDPHNHQIRAATLLSLGKHHNDRSSKAVDATAESLSRRYWDYNVLDYDEKVLDGFYDIFVLSAVSAGHGKMPSLSDLQANIGDHGFEVILVNRPIDRSLQELEQVAECIALDCQHAEISVLVQKIADVVTDHMGGPVKDANDLLARWMEKSTTLRTSLQTSLLPIGGVNIGLSRHRSLLFKVLADKVGIPCKLIKGSHYTGIDDDAVNIIKVDSDREFLVDLMAAPGILIPADVLNTKDSSKSSFNSRLTESSSRFKSDSNLVNTKAHAEYSKENEKLEEENGGHTDRMSSLEKAGLASSFPSSSNVLMPSSSGSCFDEDKDFYATSMHKDNLGMSLTSDNLKEKHNSNIQDSVDSEDLFAELNPFQGIGVGKTSSQFNTTEKKTNGFHRRRENFSSGPGRPPLPLVWKNRSPCNEFPNNKPKDFSEGIFPRKNTEANDLTVFPLASSSSASPRKIFPENFKTSGGHISETSSYSPGMGDETRLPLRNNQHAIPTSDHENVRADNPLASSQPYEDKCQVVDGTHKMGSQNTKVLEQKVHGKYITDRHERRKYTHDRFMGTDMVFRDGDSSGPTQSRPYRLDPMFDDVAELEIPWEDLVIGERIGLGSYGEVYHADWNGTEVAVKKFLDQDFYGDALDEFRSEVRIMRRLRHPNVVLFMGAVTRPPNLSIITEFLPRGSLYRLLHRPNCQIDQKRRIKMALDVAKGMNCLHTSTPTIVHRDLKSPNLLVDKNWNVKVCDFGLSRLKHNTFLSSKSTAGTPEWMAPEVLRNENSNEKCDVYSFGVILWELATLRMPWSGMNPMQVVGAVGFQNRRLDIPKELDPLVARIIWECWEIDPGLRPSFAQLTSALKPLQQLVIPFDEDVQSPSLPKEIKVESAP